VPESRNKAFLQVILQVYRLFYRCVTGQTQGLLCSIERSHELIQAHKRTCLEWMHRTNFDAVFGEVVERKRAHTQVLLLRREVFRIYPIVIGL